MPRYIKDGAYTIVIEDTPATSAQRPKTADATGASANDSKDGGGVEGVVGQEEEDQEEVINFASPAFMLQNLDIGRLTFESDRTCILKSRNQLAEIIAIQVCYYVYVALQPFVHKVEPPSIVLLGDGFMGSRIAAKLAEHGCKPYLRIFSRGEFGAKEWRKRGYTSSSNLQHLCHTQKPNILLLCSDYTSLYMIYHQLSELNLLSPESCIISCVLGAQRKRLYYNFLAPSVFRCYVEPQATVRALKSETGGSLLSGRMPSSEALGSISRVQTPMGSVARGSVASLDDTASLAKTDSHEDAGLESQDDDSTEEKSDLSPIERAAKLLVNRTPSATHFVHLVENFYCMNDVVIEEARKMALRTVVGYVESNSQPRPKSQAQQQPVSSLNSQFSTVSISEQPLQQSPKPEGETTPGGAPRQHRRTLRAPKVRSSRRKPAITVKAIEKILLSIYMDIGRGFHKEFSKILTMDELIHLSEQKFVIAQGDMGDGQPREMYVDTHGHHHTIKLQRGTKAIYDRAYFNVVYAQDDNVDHLYGPSYDYIRTLNEMEEKKPPLVTLDGNEADEGFAS